MIQINKELLRKQALLTGAGAALQFLGGMCFCAAAILAVKEVTDQIRKYLEQSAANE